MDSAILYRVAIFFGPFLFALCFHEYAHGLVAKWRGDRTAELQGRLTLNPIVHADIIGTVIFPLASIFMNLPFSFGWAKPVPVDPRNLRNVRTDMFWIALAGPLSNVFLAVMATLFLGLVFKFNLFSGLQIGIREFGQTFIVLNLYLAVFNMIPIHPLDGGKVLARFLPYEWNRKLEENEQVLSFVLMILLFSGFVTFLQVPVSVLYHFLLSFIV